MTAVPTGRLDQIEGQPVLRFSRGVLADAEAVWDAISGAEELTVLDGGTPASLTVESGMYSGPWDAGITLSQDGGVTTFTLTHRIERPEEVAEAGPVWDYHLDFLVAALSGGDLTEVTLKPDYDPGVRDYYQQLAGRLT